jgi:4,5-DOPA dioxygenase extradiol
MTKSLPAIFFGHGNPMNALQQNDFTNAWAAFGTHLPRPRALLAISAHWYGPGTAVTAMTQPRTIHDFSGFPPELYEIQYPAPGAPELARRVQSLLAPTAVQLDLAWGLDHGTWSILQHIYPAADVPVVQLSLASGLSAASHVELALRLAPLRDEGVLLLGSGNVVHNLREYAWGRPQIKPYEWAVEFEEIVREAAETGEIEPLLHYEKLGSAALQAVPTPEHFLPLLYILAQRRENDPVSFPVEGFEGGSISMLSVQIG